MADRRRADGVEMLEAYVPVVAGFDVGPAEAEHEVQFADASVIDLADGDTATYAWDFGDTGTSSERNPRHEYAAAGTYDVTLTVTTSWGGSDSEVQSVVVDAETPPRVISVVTATVVPSEAVAVVAARTEAIAAVVETDTPVESQATAGVAMASVVTREISAAVEVK